MKWWRSGMRWVPRYSSSSGSLGGQHRWDGKCGSRRSIFKSLQENSFAKISSPSCGKLCGQTVNAQSKFLRILDFWQIAHVSGASLNSSRTFVCIDETRSPMSKPAFALVTLSVLTIVTSCARLPRHFALQNAAPVVTAGTPGHNESASSINVNTASTAELEKLPGIGKILAERIVAHREQHGSFRRPEHLLMVRGISDRKFREIRSMLTVD
jgi:competence ComEA-like helix-hairpin-helix protein